MRVGIQLNIKNMFFKKINTGLIALVIGATTAFAFNAPAAKPANSLALEWFQYNGGNITSPNSYSKLPSMPSCDGSGDRCAIQAPENGSTGKPTVAGATNPDDVKLHF